MTCRVLYFALSIKGKTQARFTVIVYAVCLRISCEIKRGLSSYILRVIKIKIDIESLVIISVAAQKA